MTQLQAEFNALITENIERTNSLMGRLIDIVENQEARIAELTKQTAVLAKAINANGGY